MAHEIDTTEGQASFATAREDAWHRLGTVLPDSFTAEQAMEAAHLGGWHVRKTPLTTMVPEYSQADLDAAADAEMLGEVPPELVPVREQRITIPDRYAVVRNNPVTAGQVDPLGIVGSQYHPIQNEDHAEFLNTLVDESGAHFETAGALRGGSRVFLTMKLPDHIKVGGVDPIDLYLAAINSHDGSLPFTVMVTPVRVVCQNTLNLAWRNTNNKVKVRHTLNSHASIVSRARETLDLSFAYLDDFQAEAERLINTTLTTSRFEEIMEEAFGPAPDAHPSARSRRENQVQEYMSLFADAYTQEGIRETAWAGLNTLTEWFDHSSTVQVAGGDAAERRAENAIFSPEFKNRARSLILSSI